MVKISAKLTVALLCGGPSLERGISLNSARSVMDHLASDVIDILPIYFDAKRNPYRISQSQLYSNTPSDFDFKLQKTATPLTEKTLVQLLKKADIVFPVMHGPFGEDGQIQAFLEKHGLPYVGASAEACKILFDKFNANEFIRSHGFYTLPSIVLKIYHKDHKASIEKFFKQHKIKRAIVKPATGGSSIGVFSVSTPKEALEKVELLFSKRMDTRVVIEPFAEGIEFTLIVLENRFGLPVALPPTEIETNYDEHQIFDFRKKYLPTRQVTWHCPPRFDNRTIDKIQAQAEQLFALLKMRDFGRFDGWVMPDGNIWFCDFNPISGMEQNSFLFQQASRIGMTHSDILSYVIEQSCRHYQIPFPKINKPTNTKRKKVNILMGGSNSERQVSLMSGTNVWLKLRRSTKYQPQPYILDTKGSVWKLPYHLCLNHTVEEIIENCENYQKAKVRLNDFEERARLHLGLLEPKNTADFFEPEKLSLQTLINNSRFLFLALHGGEGENGAMQKRLEAKKVKFNGPSEKVSRLCIDKWKTSEFIRSLNIEGITTAPGKMVKTKRLLKANAKDIEIFWEATKQALHAKTLIVKPSADGCTTGIVRLHSAKELNIYLDHIKQKSTSIPKHTFKGQLDITEMPLTEPTELLFEQFIETDALRVKANSLKHSKHSGWIEITVGVIEHQGKLHALNPSITVAEGEVLTVEEKFQGGTGVNITPPPASLMKAKILQKVKQKIEHVARQIGIEGYSRIDAFVHLETGALSIIEVNTLPALTPSTVLYQQALTENKPLFPKDLLEILITNKGY